MKRNEYWMLAALCLIPVLSYFAGYLQGKKHWQESVQVRPLPLTSRQVEARHPDWHKTDPWGGPLNPWDRK